MSGEEAKHMAEVAFFNAKEGTEIADMATCRTCLAENLNEMGGLEEAETSG